jgi:hypothetical protein
VIDLDRLPDVRDGLTRVERAVLVCLKRLHEEQAASAARRARAGMHVDATSEPRHVSTAMLYGRVVEIVDVSVDEFQATLQRLIGQPAGAPRRPPR